MDQMGRLVLISHVETTEEIILSLRNRRKILSALKLQNARTEKRCLILLGIRFVLMFCLATLTLSLIAAKMINVTLAQIPVLIAVAMALTIAVVQANQ